MLYQWSALRKGAIPHQGNWGDCLFKHTLCTFKVQIKSYTWKPSLKRSVWTWCFSLAGNQKFNKPVQLFFVAPRDIPWGVQGSNVWEQLELTGGSRSDQSPWSLSHRLLPSSLCRDLLSLPYDNVVFLCTGKNEKTCFLYSFFSPWQLQIEKDRSMQKTE